MIVGVGIDIVDVKRIEALLQKFGDKFLSRVFTENEIDYCKGKRNPSLHLSARFAAKEAASKALGTGFSNGIKFIDIEVTKELAGPSLLLHNKAQELTERLGVCRMHVSISHDPLYAVATVILENND